MERKLKKVSDVVYWECSEGHKTYSKDEPESCEKCKDIEIKRRNKEHVVKIFKHKSAVNYDAASSCSICDYSDYQTYCGCCPGNYSCEYNKELKFNVDADYVCDNFKCGD